MAAKQAPDQHHIAYHHHFHNCVFAFLYQSLRIVYIWKVLKCLELCELGWGTYIQMSQTYLAHLKHCHVHRNTCRGLVCRFIVQCILLFL